MGEELKRETIIDLGDYLNSPIRVNLVGGKEITGVLKSYDKIPNLVLEDAKEKNRELGIVIVRGQMITALMPDQLTAIENPFSK